MHVAKVNDSIPNRVDTIACVGDAVISVRLLPLFRSIVVVNDLDLRSMSINTLNIISSAQIKGRVGHLNIKSRGINLSSETVDISSAFLGETHLTVLLNDTVPEDTSKTKNNWAISLQKLNVKNSSADIHMPGDTLQIKAVLGDAVAEKGYFDLGKNNYSLSRLSLLNSVVAYNKRTEQVVAVGHEALRMLGRTPAYILTECPIREGVISNHLFTEYLIQEFVKKVSRSFLIKPRIAICIPSAITRVEARAVVEAAMSAGARKVYLIDEPIAAAIGAGLDVLKPEGRMMVDSGGGTTDIAVISLGGIVVSHSLKIAGNVFDEAIVKYIQNRYKLAIGTTVAETIKKEIGCVFEPDESVTTTVKGRNLLTGYPEQITINQAELFDVMRPFAAEIVLGVRNVLERTPPELTGDIYRNGITMTGGTSQLKGLDRLIAENTGVEVRLASDPVDCVGIGTGKCFSMIEDLKEGFECASTYTH